jgi:acylphosphatase
MLQYQIRVTGKVHGVSYRAAARHAAMHLGLPGFVRNEPDGSVYIEVEGSEDLLNKFLAWCRHGSQGAIVTDVTHSAGEPVGHKGFEVRRPQKA